MADSDSLAASEAPLTELDDFVVGPLAPNRLIDSPSLSGPSPRPQPASVASAHQRRWPRRLLIGVNIVVALALIASLSAYGYVRWRLGEIRAITLPHLRPLYRVPSRERNVGGPPETILIVGSDTRAALHAGQNANFGSAADVSGQRSDTIMLLRVDPTTNQALLLSLPRDLYIYVPGTNRRDRINATFNTGPDLLVQAITEDLHIEINHFLEVDFDSFRGIVNSIGGLKLYFPTPARDAFSGLNIAVPGCYSANGELALAYVRARHLQYKEGGYWHIEPESDLARIRRQQDFVRRLVNKVVASGFTDPGRINGVVGAVVDNLTVDRDLKSNHSDLLRVAKLLKRIGGSGIETMTLPNIPTVIGGADVLLEKHPDSEQTISHFLGRQASGGSAGGSASSTTAIPPQVISPGSVRVRVENGNGRSAGATIASRALGSAGFVVTSTGPANSYRYVTTVIVYASASLAKARLLESYVQGGATLQVDPNLVGVDAVLITGSSYTGISPSPATQPATRPGGGASAPTTSLATTTTQPPALPGMPANPPPC